MSKTLITALILLSSVANAKSWMPWDNNNNGNDNLFESWMPWNSSSSNANSNWGPFDGGSNWGPFDGGSNWGPFDGGSNFGPFDSGSNWGPFSSDSNWGPFNKMNDMVNESDWGFYYNNKNTTSNKGYSRADGKYAAELESRGVGYSDAYTKGNADAYYKSQLDGYGNARGNGRFEGYGRKGYLGYTPFSGNTFPAPAN